MCVLVAQSGLTLCNPMDCSPPGSSFRGILQARILKWVAFPSPGDLPHPGMELRSPALQMDCLPLSHQGSPGLHSVTRYSCPPRTSECLERRSLQLSLIKVKSHWIRVGTKSHNAFFLILHFIFYFIYLFGCIRS